MEYNSLEWLYNSLDAATMSGMDIIMSSFAIQKAHLNSMANTSIVNLLSPGNTPYSARLIHPLFFKFF